MMQRVFLAFPYTQSSKVDSTLSALQFASENKDKYVFFPQDGPGGSHCENFNSLWCMALNSRKREGWTHFAMHHSDVMAEPGWLDILLQEMDSAETDVLSVVLKIKDEHGLTTTCLFDTKTYFNRRIHSKELYGVVAEAEDDPEESFPRTFDGPTGAQYLRRWTAKPEDTALLVSSGLWICDFTGDWVEQVWFEMRDRIARLPNGQFYAFNFSEDWSFSLQCRELGVKLCATTKVAAKHRGIGDYDNQTARGTWSMDEHASYGEWIKYLKGTSAKEPMKCYED